MRKIIASIIMLSLFVALVACGGKDAGKTSSNVLRVYSPHPSDTINLIVKEFEEKTGVKVEIVAAGTGELLKRVEAEAANPLADVFWGGGAESLAAYAKYFAPYKSPALESVNPKYYDKNHNWLGESPLPMVILYNTNLVSPDTKLDSWADVLNPKFKGKIAMADPAKSGSAYTIMATLLTAFKSDDNGWGFIRKFYDNLDGKVLSSSSGVYKGVADGEYALGLTLEKEAIKYVINGAPVKIVYPSEGTSAVPDAVAIVKGGSNVENAKKFVDFVLSQEVQTLTGAQLGRRSVRDDVAPPKGLGPMADIKLVDYDFAWAAKNKAALVKQWKDIVVGK